MRRAHGGPYGDNASGRLTAVLGPTNTGKTHLAVERMLGHRTGMIGCPLRLLAREIYDRTVAVRGSGQVALITGEERVVPERPHYWVCTVESMPLDQRVEFLAVDEIQLAADPERGHVFTDRILRARGLSETMFLGAGTMAPLLSRLVSGLEFINRPRFSTLSHTGAHKIMRLPRRSAVVAFSVSEVYRIAELLRRFRGGAAVVMGALSPRTRNAQVALYQAGEVDYLVATDAIGMGLNLALDHVAFAGARKYDGREARELNPAEVAQIAGRAGRHTRHGTFGTTLNAPAFEPEVVSAVEDHLFKPVRTLFWRNADLDLSSLPALLRSLEAPPPVRELMRPRETEDVASLRALAALPDIAVMASGHDTVSLLWDVCRIPDFRKTMADAHFQLLATIFRHLMSGEGLLPKAWVERMVDQLDRSEGDIDGLATRIAHVRTWNYIAQRPRWVADPRALRERARAIEDKLSDALHERLTQRFVDRKTTRLTRRMRESGSLIAAITRSGEVVVEGEYVGRLLGFDLVPDDAETWREGRALRAAVRSALAPEIRKRAGSLVSDEDEAFTLATDGTVSWRDSPVARLARGAQSLSPGLKLLVGDLVEDASRRRVEQRLSTWLAGHIAEGLAPLWRAREADLVGAARGLVFQLAEGLGCVVRQAVSQQIDALESSDRKSLAALGIRLGRDTVFLAALLKPKPIALRGLLWCVANGALPPKAPDGRVSLAVDPALSEGFVAATGYRQVGPLLIRVDMFERFTAELRRRARRGPVAPDAALLNIAGCTATNFEGVAQALGYRREETEDGIVYVTPQPRRAARRRKPRRQTRTSTASPFAVLDTLKRSGR